MSVEIENTLTHATFKKSLGTCFVLTMENIDPMELKLVEVKCLQSTSGAPRKEPFSLLFQGPKDVYFPQGLYELEHDQMGRLTLFMVPVGSDEQGTCFESIFN